MAANCVGLSLWIDASPAVLSVGTEAAADAAAITASASAHVTPTRTAVRAFVSSRDTDDEHTGRRFERCVAQA
jgi:hypothetical protein